MSKIIEYLQESGVFYRHLKDDGKPERGEIVYRYHAYHHPSGKSWVRRIAIPCQNSVTLERSKVLELMNRWNWQPSTGWHYYVTDYFPEPQ